MFDKNLYLERIGFRQTAAADLPALRALMRCHLETVPFENLDIFDLHRPISLEPDELFDKIVLRRRGGYCFELNGLFFRLLTALGFVCEPVAARVLWNKSALPPLTHRAAVVTLAGVRYYCDVGFGGPGPREPLALRPDQPQELCGERFLLGRDGAEWRILRGTEDGFRPVLQFQNEPFREIDFQPLNYYCSNSPEILFVRQRVVSLTTAAGSCSLTGDDLTLRRDGRTETRTLSDPAARRAALEQYFGLRIPEL